MQRIVFEGTLQRDLTLERIHTTNNEAALPILELLQMALSANRAEEAVDTNKAMQLALDALAFLGMNNQACATERRAGMGKCFLPHILPDAIKPPEEPGVLLNADIRKRVKEHTGSHTLHKLLTQVPKALAAPRARPAQQRTSLQTRYKPYGPPNRQPRREEFRKAPFLGQGQRERGYKGARGKGPLRRRQ